MNEDLCIEYRICRNNLGTDEFAEQYEEALATALEEEYDESEVEVSLDSELANADQIVINARGAKADAIRERVKVIAGVIRGRMG